MDLKPVMDFVTAVYDRIFTGIDGKLSVIQEQIMKVSETVLADLGVVKANLTETRADLAKVLELNTKQTENITALETQVADLKAELAGKVEDLTALDTIAAQVAEIKATSREIADVVPPQHPIAGETTPTETPAV